MKDAPSSRWRRAESAGSEGTEAEATGGRLHRPLAAQLAPELPAYAPTFPCPGAVPKAKGEARKRASAHFFGQGSGALSRERSLRSGPQNPGDSRSVL